MTESEARTKWCAFAGSRTVRGQVVAEPPNDVWQISNFFGPEYGKLSARCIASDCMMWRWLPWPPDTYRSGYCGLGGMPT